MSASFDLPFANRDGRGKDVAFFAFFPLEGMNEEEEKLLGSAQQANAPIFTFNCLNITASTPSAQSAFPELIASQAFSSAPSRVLQVDALS